MTLDYDELAMKVTARGGKLVSASGTEGAHTMTPAPENEPKPTTLQQAQSAWRDAQFYYETSENKGGNGYYRSQTEAAKQDAATLAAIAQAEALTRLAEVVEELLESDSVLPLLRAVARLEAEKGEL